MKLKPIFLAVIMPCLCIGQTTSKDFIKAFDKPEWKTKMAGMVFGDNIGIWSDTLVTASIVTVKSPDLFETFNYLGKKTGKVWYSVTVPMGCFTFYSRNLLYYTSNDSLIEFDDNLFQKKTLAIIPGYKLRYTHMSDSVIYVGSRAVADTNDCPLFSVNRKTGTITKYPFNLYGGFIGFYNGVMVWYDNSFNYFGTDIKTNKTLWKIDFGYKPIQNRRHDSTVYNHHGGPLIINDTIRYIKSVWYRNNFKQSTASSVAMDIHTGKIISEKQEVINDTVHPAYSAYVTDNSPAKGAKKRYYLTHDNGKTLKTWKFDITKYYGKAELDFMSSPNTFSTIPTVTDSDKLYVNLFHTFWCFNEQSGKLLWHKHVKGIFNSNGIMITGNFFLLFDRDMGSIAVINENNPNDASTLKLRYNSFPDMTDGNSIYIADKDNNLMKINLPE
jgi:hypothetical protein